MKSHATTVFGDRSLRAFRLASDVVEAIPCNGRGEFEGELLRCHEVARTVFSFFTHPDLADSLLVDGKFGPMPHSWIYAPTSYDTVRITLDPYAVGRLPQVQLVEIGWDLSRGYKYGPVRTDIRLDVIAKLLASLAEKGLVPYAPP